MGALGGSGRAPPDGLDQALSGRSRAANVHYPERVNARSLLTIGLALGVTWAVIACGDDAAGADASGAQDEDGSIAPEGEAGEPGADASFDGSQSGDGDGDGGGDDEDGALHELADGGDGGADIPPRRTLRLSEIAVGYNHACAIDLQGGLHCWGANALGQLGVGDQADRDEPARVGEASDWRAVSAGRFHTCGVRSDGGLYCWGGGAFGQAGRLQAAVLEPSSVAAPSGAWTGVTAGQWHTCGLTDHGQLYCWGYNLLGRLGDGTGAGTDVDPEQSVDTPVRVLAGIPFKAVSAGHAHTCALDADDAAWCWGSGEDGRLGAPAPDACALGDSEVPCALEPIALADGRSYTAISAGGAHACALQASGALWCWGKGAYGQLGIGDPGDPSERLAPVQAEGEHEAVVAGAEHTCVIASDGRARCFGDGANGQLGTAEDAAFAPIAVELQKRVGRVASGALGSCAVTTSNAGYCWGLSAYSGSITPGPLFQY